MTTPTQELHDRGQSLWLDNITRAMLDEGAIARYIDEYAVTGLTSNPSIFDNAIASGAYDEAIRAGRAAFDRLTRVAAVQGPLLADLVTALAADDPSRAQLDSIRGGFAQLVTQKRAFDRSIAELRKATDARPFPDDARAAAAVSANLKHWSEELAAASRSLADRAARGVEQPALAAWLETAPMEFTSLARELRVAQDALDRLPRLYGAEVGSALAAGNRPPGAFPVRRSAGRISGAPTPRHKEPECPG